MSTLVPRRSRVASELLAPVVGAIDPILRTHRHPGLVPGLTVPDEDGWPRATQIVNGSRLADLLDPVQRLRQASEHAAATLAWKSYSYWLALPAILGWATARQVPLLRPADVLVRFADQRTPLTLALRRSVRVAVLPSSPLADSGLPQVQVVADEAAMLAILRESLLDGHLTPLLAAIHARVRVGTRTLLGSVSSGIAHGLLRAADSLPGPAVDHITTILRTLGIDDLVDLSADPTGRHAVRRKTCCLAFTLPTPSVCAGCCINAGSPAGGRPSAGSNPIT